jgi:hypothetical protein
MSMQPSKPRFTDPIPEAGPDRESWNQSLEIARNGIADAIQNGVTYGDRYFKTAPNSNPPRLEFGDRKPEYDDDISLLPYPKLPR